MTTSVVWSPSLRLAVKKGKEMKAITSTDFYNGQAVTALEKQAIQKQLSPKSQEVSAGPYWQ